MKVSVIIAVWNGMEYLPDCLDAVMLQSYSDFEVVVVDDASTDGSANYVAQHYPSVRLLRNEHNSGYSRTCNRGLDIADGDILVLLNQDTKACPGWLEALVEAIKSDRTVGIVGGKCLYPEGTIQHAGGYLDAQGGGHHYGYGGEDQGQCEQRRKVEFVTGANLAISRSALEAVGRLDEKFSPAYFEDVDWCMRAWDAGFQVIYEPKAIVIHDEASLIIGEDREVMYFLHRNRLRLVLKHWPLSRLVGEFFREESSWLRSLEARWQYIGALMHSVYFFYLLDMDDILTSRSEKYILNDAEIGCLSEVLLELRAIVPLKLSDTLDSLALSLSEFNSNRRARPLSGLQNSYKIEALPFRSTVPVIGPLIAQFRRLWNRVSTEWYVRPLIRQQTEFNEQVVEVITQLDNDLTLCQENLVAGHKYLIEILSEYLSENGKEIASLASVLSKRGLKLEDFG
jgi:GT2 family glycosyltransferase